VVRGGGVVRWLAELPASFAGVRRFRALAAAEQAALGVLPVVDVTRALDDETERLAAAMPAVTVFADRVEIARPIRPLTPAEIEAREAAALELKRRAALAALAEQALAEAAADPDAPAEVKDYHDG
jgi:electron transfer flavoprotein alpha/beta subunit